MIPLCSNTIIIIVTYNNFEITAMDFLIPYIYCNVTLCTFCKRTIYKFIAGY